VLAVEGHSAEGAREVRKVARDRSDLEYVDSPENMSLSVGTEASVGISSRLLQRRPGVRLSVILMSVLLTAATLRADDPTLSHLTIEQLLEIPLVSVASKRPQKAREAPSVISVITAEEIQRHGYRTLADALRTLPGFYVTDDRNYSYVGVRGFGRPGDYNTRVLLLIDGVRTNDNIYDGAYVERVMPLDTTLIQRIEVSRGPGSSVYGDNAFFAVINVVTKRGGQSLGTHLQAGASSYGSYEGEATYGRRLAKGGEVLASASQFASDGQTLYFPEFPEGTVRGGDGEHSTKLFASFSKGGLLVEAVHSSRGKHVPTASYDTAFGDTRAVTRDAFTTLSASYQRSLGARFDWSSRLAFEAYDYEGTYPYNTDGTDVSLFKDFGHGRSWIAESTGVLRSGRHTLMLGGELTLSPRQDQGGGYLGVADTAFRASDHGIRYGAFAQDDLQLGEIFRLSVGGRYNHHEDFSGQADPRVALIATPDRRTTIKLLYGSAYRAPNEYEQNYYSAQAAHPELQPESIRTYEVSIERQLGANARVTTSIFANDIHDLLSLESDAGGDLFFENRGRARSRGGEAALELHSAFGLASRLSYSYQRTRDGANLPLSNSPSHMIKADLTIPLWTQAAWASLDAQYLSSRLTLAHGRSGGFVLVNATLFAAHIMDRLEASASVYNVLDAKYADPGSTEHRQDAIQQNGRSFAVKLGWRF
jgi:outer membrane receptor for ferrienterochelin and colicin